MREKITTIIAVFLVGIIIFEGYLLFKNDNTIDDGNESGTYVAELVDDECTEEYEQVQNATTVSSVEEKLSANAILILKKYYQKCEHTINEYVELPQEFVNLTEKEVQAENSDWEVIGFEKGKLTLYKEFDDVCGEHFKLKVEQGKVVIYIVNNDGTD